MKHHEREFFISIIRSGKLFIHHKDIELEIRPINLDDLFRSCKVYNDAYEKAYADEIMTEEDMDNWMLENGLWTHYDNNKEEGLKKDIERLKIEIYNARNDTKLANNIRLYIRAGELQLSNHLNKKYMYYQNTCEGVAATEKLSWIIKNTTFLNNKLYNFEELSLQYVIDEWQSHFLSEHKSRELARNEPWRSLWITRENSSMPLFANPPNTDLTYNQKNILIWSQMYDNIQESMECPDKNVIEDDDMLDGWFIIQSQKRERDRTEKEFENQTRSEKIKNASEVFVVADANQKIKKINDMNDPITKAIKKQRELFIKTKGSVEDQNLPDQRQKIQMMSVNQMRGNMGG